MNMREPTTAWDHPPTDKQLHGYYGNVPSSFDIACAIDRHANALDRDDLSEVCHEYAAEILKAVKNQNAQALMDVFSKELKATVARSASIAVYGDAFAIHSSEVTL